MGKRAFTFAEVMITITVIGVVAALTMPGLVAHYHEEEYVSQLQKALSQFEQGMQHVMFRHECTDIVCTGLYDGTATDNEWNTKFDEEMQKSIKIIKSEKNGKAMQPELQSGPLKPKDAKLSTQVDWRSTVGYKFMTPDGVMYQVIPKNCEFVPHPTLSTIENICAQNGHLYPLYSRDYSNATTGSPTGTSYWRTNDDLCAGEGTLNEAPENVSGDGCAARIIEEGWKMTY